MARLRLHNQQVEFHASHTQLEAEIRQSRQQLRERVANLERMMIYGVEQSPRPWAVILSPKLEARIAFKFANNWPSWSTKGLP